MREGSPPHTCHVSGVTCHVSHVKCHQSHVTCHVSHVRLLLLYIYIFIFFGQSGEASQGRVCYQRGLPRLVLLSQSPPNMSSIGEVCDGLGKT